MLRRARTRASLSQRRLARRSGIPQSAIARIERGHVSPRVDTLDRLLSACGMTLHARAKRGVQVDRTVIRRFLEMTPDERVHVAAESSTNAAALTEEMRRQL